MPPWTSFAEYVVIGLMAIGLIVGIITIILQIGVMRQSHGKEDSDSIRPPPAPTSYLLVDRNFYQDRVCMPYPVFFLRKEGTNMALNQKDTKCSSLTRLPSKEKVDFGILIINILLFFVYGYLIFWQTNSDKTRDRAYVAFQNMKWESLPENQTACAQVKADVFNAGNTPANNIEAKIDVITANNEDGLREEFSRLTQHPQKNSTRGIGSFPPHWGEPIITNVICNKAGRGADRDNADIYVIGIITYDDVFGSTHTTRMCRKKIDQNLTPCPELNSII